MSCKNNMLDVEYDRCLASDERCRKFGCPWNAYIEDSEEGGCDD